MERLLARLERRYAAYAIPHLTAILVAGMASVFLMAKARPDLVGALTLDLDDVKRGQVWRLVTFLFLPRTMDPLWIFFSLGFVWYVGSTLEGHWGSFRFNLFYLLGCLGTVVAAFLTGHAENNAWLNYSLMLAFGTLFPEERFFLFLVVPVKAKWFAIADAVFLTYSMVVGDAAIRGAIVAALAGYFVFCGQDLRALFRQRRLAVRQAARRAEMPPTESSATGHRICALCGAREEDGVDIRVCSCAKCGRATDLCLPHARSH